MSNYEPPSSSQSNYRRDVPGAGFFSWIRSLNLVRSDNSWFGGVCAGIADKIRVEPKFVRLAAVIGAIFFGSTFVIYAAGWLLMPDARDQIHLENMLGRNR